VSGQRLLTHRYTPKASIPLLYLNLEVSLLVRRRTVIHLGQFIILVLESETYYIYIRRGSYCNQQNNKILPYCPRGPYSKYLIQRMVIKPLWTSNIFVSYMTKKLEFLLSRGYSNMNKCSVTELQKLEILTTFFYLTFNK